MDERGRKEEPSLPPDYVSLAQLQERWLQKQEERKLKEKQEEEEMRERDAGAQKEKNQNQKGRGEIAGGVVRNTGVIHDKGKGKEMVTSGPGNEGENDKRREVIQRGKTRYFKRAAAVEEKAKDSGAGDWSQGVGSVAGDAEWVGIRSRGGGVGDVVEEKCDVSVGEVLSCNGVREEIADVKRTDLRGGSRGNGRKWGSRRVNELHSETGLNLEKKVENERGHDQNWRGRGRGRGKNGGHLERLKGNEVESTLEKKTEDKITDVLSEISSLSVVDGNGVRGRNSQGSNKVNEDIVEEEGSNGHKMALMIEKVDHEVLSGESAVIGKHRGVVKGYQINDNRRKNLGQERRHTRPEIATEKNRVEGEGLNGSKMVVEIEKKVDHEVLAEESAKIDENMGLVKGNRKKKKSGRKYRRPNVSAKGDEIDGEDSKGNNVALEVEKKKMDHEVLAGESLKPGDNRWIVKSNQKNEGQMKNFGKERRFTRPNMSAKVNRIEGEGSEGYKVRPENDKKVGREILARENAKIGVNRGFFRGHQRNEQWRGGFNPGMRPTRYEISDSRWKMNSRENGMVWVKKEEKLGGA